MTVNYPTSLDTLTNPDAGDPLSSPSHSGQHSDANDILEALEAKVGIGASTPTSGKVLTGDGAGSSSWQDPASASLPAGTDPGDLLVYDGSDWDVLPIGSDDDVLTADSGEPLGVKWAAGGGGGGGLPPAKQWLVDESDPRDYPASPNATYDDEFNDESGMSGSGNGLNARWAWRNQGTSTITFPRPGWATITPPASSSQSFRTIEINAFADGTYEARLSLEVVTSGWCGIVLVDGTNGDNYVFGFGMINGVGNGAAVVSYSNSTAGSPSVLGSAQPFHPITHAYLKVTKSSTTLTAWIGWDGIGWKRVHTWTDSVGATRIGLCVSEQDNSGLTRMHINYFRKTA